MSEGVHTPEIGPSATDSDAWGPGLITASVDAIVAADLAGTVRLWNPAAERLYGYTADEMLGRAISVLGWPAADDATMQRVAGGESLKHQRVSQTRRDGRTIVVSVSASPVTDRDGQVVGIATIARDIEARIRQQEQLEFLADHDPLTGAGNRRRFERDLSHQMGRFRRHREDACLLMIDLDAFKAVNDDHGHGVGDETLRRVADVLRERLRRSDSFARIGGDEFAVLLPYTSPEQAHHICDDLSAGIAALEIPTATGILTGISASIGIAHIAKHASGDELLSAADRAMYDTKDRRPLRSARAGERETAA